MVLLYDQFGQKMKVKTRPETRTIAVAAIRDKWSSYPGQGLTPEKLTALFKEADGGDVYRQAELFEEMEEKDTHLFSQLQTRKNAVLGLDYEILPYSESVEDKKIRDFVADNISGLNNFDEILLDLLDAVGKGYSLAEIMWGIDGGKAIIQGFQWIHPKKASFYDFGKGPWDKSLDIPRIITEAEPMNGELMPPFKLVYHRYKARSGYDTRAGVLRVCAWMYLFKNYGIKDWVSFMEVFGIPLRLGKYDPGANKEDKDALVSAIQSLGSDAAGIISKNTEIEFVEAIKGRFSDNPFKGLAEFCDAQISKAILGQTATTEGTPGKLGNENAQDQVRHDLLESDAKALGKTCCFQIFRPIVGYNFGWDKPLPNFNFHVEEPEDLKELSETYKNLSEINYPLTVEHVSERFKVPAPKKGETVLAPRVTGPLSMKNYDRITAKSAKFTLEQEKVEGLIGEAMKRASNALTGLQQPVREMIAGAKSLEEIRDNIMAKYSDMDSKDLEELIARAMFTAELFGRATVAE